jgi:hypothetical protein
VKKAVYIAPSLNKMDTSNQTNGDTDMNELTIELIGDEYHFSGFIPDEELTIDFYAPNIETGLSLLSTYNFDTVTEI